MFDLSFMPIKTKNVFEILVQQKFINDYTLFGGTALSVQLKHRKSEDLDFIYDGKEIDKKNIKRSINSIFSNYRIINEDQNFQIDFLINEVKVTFFSSGAVLVPFNVKEYSIKLSNINIAMPNIIGVLKLITISQRNTLRDYYDLYFLTKEFMSMNELFKLTMELVPNLAPITYSETLTYADDIEENSMQEYLEPVENISKTDITEYFINEIKKIKKNIKLS